MQTLKSYQKSENLLETSDLEMCTRLDKVTTLFEDTIRRPHIDANIGVGFFLPVA